MDSITIQAKALPNYAATTESTESASVNLEVTTNTPLQATFEGRPIVQLTELLPSILRKIIDYATATQGGFTRTFPSIARVSKVFYKLYLQTVEKSSFKLYITANGLNACLQFLVRHCPNLSSLDLSNCLNLTDAHLKHLQCLPALRHLMLEACKITDSGLAHLKKLTALEELNLSYCHNITGEGLKHLKGLSTLHSLNLYHCTQITDEDLKHLAGVVALTSLNLSYSSQIKGYGFKYLLGLTALKTLNLGRARHYEMVQAAIDRLAPHLPNLDIQS